MARPVVASHRRPDCSVQRADPLPVRAVRQPFDRLLMPAQHRDFFRGGRIPEPNGLVGGTGGKAFAVGAVGQRENGAFMPAQGADGRTGRRVPEVDRVASSRSTVASWSPDGLMIGRCHNESRGRLSAGHHGAGAVELAVQVSPLPAAVLRRRRLEGPPGRVAVLELQGRRGGRDVRPIAFPAFGLAGRSACCFASTALAVAPFSWRFAAASDLASSSATRRACSALRHCQRIAARATRPVTTRALSKAAGTGFRRPHRVSRPSGPTGRAGSARRLRNRPRSSASSPAVAYRFPGFLLQALQADRVQVARHSWHQAGGRTRVPGKPPATRSPSGWYPGTAAGR